MSRSSFFMLMLCCVGLISAPRAAFAAPISLGGDLAIDLPLVFDTPNSGINCNGHTISNPDLRTPDEAIRITSHSVQVTNCVIRGFRTGVRVNARAIGPDILIQDSDIRGQSHAVQIVGATGAEDSHILVINSVLESTIDEATVDISDARYVDIVLNTISATAAGEGVLALRARDVILVSNTVSNASREGSAIYVDASRDVQVNQNDISDTRSAIHVTDTEGTTVNLNTIHEPRSFGIRVGGIGVQELITVFGNSVFGAGRAGISVTARGEVVISGNWTEESGEVGIGLTMSEFYNGEPIVIRDNVLVNEVEIAVRGLSSPPLNLTMVNNTYITQ